MEAFGRMIAVLAGECLVLLLTFYLKTVPLHWQKTETVRSITKAYAAELMESKEFCAANWETLKKELGRFGEYEIEYTVFERRRYEGENGRVYLYHEWKEEQEQKTLLEGSYLRIVVKEKKRGGLETFLYGADSVFYVGGRVS